jgi:phosphonate transport system substrate-binding protein
MHWERNVRTQSLYLCAVTAAALLSCEALADPTCTHRGDLDTPFCDNNADLVADAPTDAAKWKNPTTIAFTYTPTEDPAVYERLFRPFTDYLSQCTGRRTVFFPVQSNAAEIEAMRTGRLHVAWYSTGPTAYAVNIAGAVPFAAKGDAHGIQGYCLLVLVKRESAYRQLSDLRGKRIAHTSPSSNSGHLAPLALFPPEGLTPGKDYQIVFSGKHDRSIQGVASGEYDAAAVASDVFDRMVRRGQVKPSDFRVIYRSSTFPTEAVAHSHDLEPGLRDQLIKCFREYHFPAALRTAFDGADRFVAVNYQKDWQLVRKVGEAAGEKFTRADYERTMRTVK